MFRTVFAISLLALTSCRLGPGFPMRRPCGADGRLVGHWRADIRQTQMGRGYDEIDYFCDCTLKMRMTLLDAHVSLPEVAGTFKTSGDRITSRADDRVVTHTFWFEGKELIERELAPTGTDTFRYRKVAAISCN